MKANVKTTIHAILVILVACIVISFMPEAANEDICVKPQGDSEVIAELMQELRERSNGSMYAR